MSQNPLKINNFVNNDPSQIDSASSAKQSKAAKKELTKEEEEK